ncbi:MAG: hypothetical protein ACI4L8_03195 [Candidatus Fimadaptatus sp.]
MKKLVAIILAVCMMAMGAVASAQVEVDALAQVVRSALDAHELNYEYDAEDELFRLTGELDNGLGEADVTIFLYDDMVSVTVDCPLTFDEAAFADVAVFTTLVNSEIYYAQFRVNREQGWVTCRSCNVIESVMPSEEEIYTLLYMPFGYVDSYSEGLAAVCAGSVSPYEAFEECQAAQDA